MQGLVDGRGGFPHNLCVMWKHKCAVNSSLGQTCSLTTLRIINEFPLTCWCHTDSGWLCNPPPSRKSDGNFLFLLQMTDSLVFALPTWRLRWHLVLHLFLVSMATSHVWLQCHYNNSRIWVLAPNANLFVWAESRSAGTSSRFSSRFSSIISRGETESKQQAASRCPRVLQHSH